MARPVSIPAELDLTLNLRKAQQQFSQIQKSFPNAANVRVNFDENGAKNFAVSMRKIGTETQKATNFLDDFAAKSALAFKRYTAFTIATFGFLKFTRGIADAFRNAVDFERELVRVGQVSERSLSSLSGLSEEVFNLTTNLGVNSNELIRSARVLTQAGFSIEQVQDALGTLAKTDLAPNFKNLADTTNASIAILRQFDLQVNQLEESLSDINRISSRTAVEASDIAAAITRAGGSFAQAGGNLEEFIALFTTVREQTRAAPETIATALRTILPRLQRRRSLNVFETFGIDLRDENRQFVGPFEAFSRISDAVERLGGSARDPRVFQIFETLGGARGGRLETISALLSDFADARKNLNILQEEGNTLDNDAAQAQQALATQLDRVREEFSRLGTTLEQNVALRTFTAQVLALTRNLLQLANAIAQNEILSSLLFLGVGIGGARLLGGFGGRVFKAFKTSNFTGAFNEGGKIPGRGPNKDDRLIAVTGGEFVLKRSAVDRIGVSTLNLLNKTGDIPGFVEGGIVRRVINGKELFFDEDTGRFVSRQRASLLGKPVGAATPPLIVPGSSGFGARASNLPLGTSRNFAGRLGANLGSVPPSFEVIERKRPVGIGGGTVLGPGRNELGFVERRIERAARESNFNVFPVPRRTGLRRLQSEASFDPAVARAIAGAGLADVRIAQGRSVPIGPSVPTGRIISPFTAVENRALRGLGREFSSSSQNLKRLGFTPGLPSNVFPAGLGFGAFGRTPIPSRPTPSVFTGTGAFGRTPIIERPFGPFRPTDLRGRSRLALAGLGARITRGRQATTRFLSRGEPVLQTAGTALLAQQLISAGGQSLAAEGFRNIERGQAADGVNRAAFGSLFGKIGGATAGGAIAGSFFGPLGTVFGGLVGGVGAAATELEFFNKGLKFVSGGSIDLQTTNQKLIASIDEADKAIDERTKAEIAAREEARKQAISAGFLAAAYDKQLKVLRNIDNVTTSIGAGGRTLEPIIAQIERRFAQPQTLEAASRGRIGFTEFGALASELSPLRQFGGGSVARGALVETSFNQILSDSIERAFQTTRGSDDIADTFETIITKRLESAFGRTSEVSSVVANAMAVAIEDGTDSLFRTSEGRIRLTESLRQNTNIDAAIQSLDVIRQRNEALSDILSRRIDAENSVIDAVNNANQIRSEFQINRAAFFNRPERAVGIARQTRQLRLEEILGGVSGTRLPQIARAGVQARNRLAQIQGGPQTPASIQAANEQIRIIERTNRALQDLAQNTEVAATLESELNRLREQRETLREGAFSFTFGSDEQRRELNRAAALTSLAAQQGNLEGIRSEDREAVGQLLSQFADVRRQSFGFNAQGQARTGRELANLLIGDTGFVRGGVTAPSQQERQVLGQLGRETETRALATQTIAQIDDSVNRLTQGAQLIVENFGSAVQQNLAAAQAPIRALSEQLKNIPATLDGNFTHRVEVIFNGAEVLQRLIPEIQNIALNTAKSELNKFIEENMPEAPNR